MRSLRRLLGIAMLSCLAFAARAGYPDKPVRIVVPFAAGGPADSVARVISTELSARLGQPVIVENMPGAQGVVAGRAVATSPADGYTLLYAISATAALPVVTRTSYDMAADFAPISTIGTYDFCMMVGTTLPPKSVREFVEYAKAHPGELNYATQNLGEQYAAASFMSAAGLQMTRVPYKSMSQILPDMVQGQVHVNFGPLNNGLALAKGGHVRVLATLGAARSALAPDVPTMSESGLPGVSFESVQMLYAPARTPPEIVARLSREVNAALAQPEVRAKLEKLTLKVQGSTPAAMRQAQAAADADWARMAGEYHLSAQ